MTPAASRESSPALGFKKRHRTTSVPLSARINGLVRQCDQKRHKDRVPQEWFCAQHSGNRWSLGCRGFSRVSKVLRLEGFDDVSSNLQADPGKSGWRHPQGSVGERLCRLAASPPRLALEAQLAPLLQKAFCSLLAASDGQRILQFLTVMFGKH